MTQPVQRRLSAILSADVVGFSRLMEIDEADTLNRLKALRRDVIDPCITSHSGRIVKLMGDGALVEFGSVVDAVQCAVAIQEATQKADPEQPEERRIKFRIGVNLGDIIVDGDDIYGDGVNIAARLETLAEPGGICVSGKVHDELHRKLEIGFEDLGHRELKNIAEPIRVYRVILNTRQAPPIAKHTSSSGKPTVAVLPFNNMSGDPEQEYFADGITEDIFTELSRFKNLFVIARNSSFHYKGQSPKIQDVGRALGAQYVVEGSVRKAGNRVRVTAQLIEAATESHLWAERYDRSVEDIFAVQDEVVRAIAGVIPGQLDRYAIETLRRQPPSNLVAYDCELRGRWALTHWNEGLAAALEWYERAIEADPGYAVAHAGLALAYSYGLYVLGLPPETALTRAREHAERATNLDDRNPTVNAYAALVYSLSGEHSLAAVHADRAVRLNPNDPFTLFAKASEVCYDGSPEEALEWFARSERIDPYSPDDQRLDCLCDCHYMLRQYQKVIEIHGVYQNIPAFLYIILAAAYAQLGESENAAKAIATCESIRPAALDIKTMIKYQMKMCARDADREHWLEGYRKAGLDV